MATYNISRITSSVLRMIGGGIRWVGGALHITSEDGNTPADINVNGVEFQHGVRLTGPNALGTPHEMKLPDSPGDAGDSLINDGNGNLTWGSSADSHDHVLESIAVAIDGQTEFTLSETPKDNSSVHMYINGILAVNGYDFTVLGTLVTWNDLPFTLETSDTVVFSYSAV